jgi:hypothetical protein
VVLPLDFTVIGFPKCGTTAMIRMLAASPALFVSSQRKREADALMAAGGPVPPDPPRPHGNKFAGNVYQSGSLGRMLAENPDVLFVIGVRPSGGAMLSWFEMHRAIALRNQTRHFAAATEEARAFYSTCTEVEYYTAYARDRLKYAEQLRRIFALKEGLNYVIVSQARLAQDARGVARDIHARLGVSADEAYYDALPTGHTPKGSRDFTARIPSPHIVAELLQNDRDLLALLDTIDPSRVLRSEAGGF